MKYKREPELETIADLADQFSYFIAGVILLSETNMITLLMQERWKMDIFAKPFNYLIWAVKAVRRLGA